MMQHGQLTPALRFLETEVVSNHKQYSLHVCSSPTVAYMNRVRLAPTSQNNIVDSDDLKMKGDSQEELLSVGSKRKAPKGGEDPHAVEQRWE